MPYPLRPSLRNDEDIDMIFEELMNVKAFRHLSNAVCHVELLHFIHLHDCSDSASVG